MVNSETDAVPLSIMTSSLSCSFDYDSTLDEVAPIGCYIDFT